MNYDNHNQNLLDYVNDCRKKSMSFKNISNELGVGSKWLYNWRRRVNYQDSMSTSISNEDLDSKLIEYCMDHPNRGEVMLHSCLVTDNIHVTRKRLRESMHRVDADGVHRRKYGFLVENAPQLAPVIPMVAYNAPINSTSFLPRRVYHVEGPHHLWHLNGNLQLSHFHLVIHAAVDGFSRLSTFIHCSDNNRSSTVLHHFQGAVQRYTCPSRVKTDKGLENMEVAVYMIEQRGLNRGSIITGGSVQNQRIVRFWIEAYKEVLQLYHEVFDCFEQVFALNFEDPNTLFCLHYLFLHRINADLELFRQRWNNHKLRTERYKTPNQLVELYADRIPFPPEVIDEDLYGEEFVDEHGDAFPVHINTTTNTATGAASSASHSTIAAPATTGLDTEERGSDDEEGNNISNEVSASLEESIACPISEQQYIEFSLRISPLGLDDRNSNEWGITLLNALDVLDEIVNRG